MSKSRSRSYTRPSAKRKNTSKAKRNTRPAIIASALAIVIAVVALVWSTSQKSSETTLLGGLVQEYASEGSAHIPVGQQGAYRSNPPHSGPHYPIVTNPALYKSQIPDEVVVHNLEHGHVVLYYKPGALSAEDEEYLATLAKTYTGEWAAFLAVPRPDMDAELVLAAWRHLLPMETLDRTIVEAFIDEYIGRGPENPVR